MLFIGDMVNWIWIIWSTEHSPGSNPRPDTRYWSSWAVPKWDQTTWEWIVRRLLLGHALTHVHSPFRWLMELGYQWQDWLTRWRHFCCGCGIPNILNQQHLPCQENRWTNHPGIWVKEPNCSPSFDTLTAIFTDLIPPPIILTLKGCNNNKKVEERSAEVRTH